MAKIDFTPRQKDAINAPVAGILVSAAAGSGKTAVLTQRIIKNLIDEESSAGIGDMLVVTFTKAAAGELKIKISKAIAKAYAENPNNRFLRKQLLEIENADISTIHSFCADIVREYSEELGLPHSMKITDTAQIKLLYRDTMEQVISESYEENTEQFNEFVENFTSLRDGKLCDTLLEMYDKLQSYTEGVEYIRSSSQRLLEIAENGFEASKYAEHIAVHLKNLSKYCYTLAEHSLDFFKNSEKYSYQCVTIESDLALFKSVADYEGSYGELSDYVKACKFKSMISTKTEDKDADYTEQEKLRNKYKSLFTEFVKEYFPKNIEATLRSAKKSALFCDILYNTLKTFDQRIMSEKVGRSMMDYNDLERYAHKLLCKDGRPTEYAREVARRYKQIYIDEYQDISPVQDEIFSSISTDNIFMVGDIKQSIYGFRGSAPALFASYRERYPDYDPTKKQKALKIFLTENFRCDKNVIGFSNMVFASLFRHDLAEVPYLPEDALVCKKKHEDDKGEKVTVALIEYGEDDIREEREAQYVASQIKKLIGEGVKAKDIAIMLRKTKNVVNYYKKALDNEGIRYVTDAKKNLLDLPEIMLMQSLLEVIDNSSNDIALAACLKSPLFCFTLDELITLADEKQTSLCKGLKKHVEENDDSLSRKGKVFLSWLEKCRARARECSSDELIRYIYSEYALEGIIRSGSDDPGETGENLNRFYQLAVDYEASSFKGLSSFVRHIDQMKSRKISAESTEPSVSDDGKVNLITVHHSKGLEYQVCFLCDLARRINNPDASQELLTDRELGISLKLRDDSGYIKYDTLMRKAGSLSVTKSVIDEEMRVLYVALTRAKNKLYLTASTKDADKLIADSALSPGKQGIYYGYSASKQFIKWILASCSSDDCYEIVKVSKDTKTDEREQAVEQSIKADAPAFDGDYFEKVKGVIDYQYERLHAPSFPSKIAVSALYPAFLDENEDPMNRSMKELPDFMLTEKRATPAQIGTATHLFMQFCSFSSVEKDGVENELLRLVKEKYISKESAELVEIEKVKRFFNSDLYKEMRSSGELYREYRFNVLVDARDFTLESREEYKDQRVLVQGVIDCFFRLNNNTFKIVDYKTDRAYGRNPESTIANDYRYQLMYYKKAIEDITGNRVQSASIYAFDLGKEIPVEI